MAVSKRTRFEVFKRDSFTCQYCGRKAPDVTLEADHIDPRSAGGTDDLLNLITACLECNRGKSGVPLDSSIAMEKKFAQLEALQVRREQLEMMMEWQAGLATLEEDTLSQACEFWRELTKCQFRVSESGRSKLAPWIRKFGAEEVVVSMRIASEQYFRWKESNWIDPSVDQQSVEFAFNKIGGILYTRRESTKKPWIPDRNAIVSILKRRLNGHFTIGIAYSIAESALKQGVDTTILIAEAKKAKNWTAWRELVEQLVADAYHWREGYHDEEEVIL